MAVYPDRIHAIICQPINKQIIPITKKLKIYPDTVLGRRFEVGIRKQETFDRKGTFLTLY